VPHSPASPESSPRPFDFATLGAPRSKAPPSARTLPPVPAAEASGDLDELSADDILESDDIEPFEAAAAGIKSFEAPAAEPSGFEVAELDTFDEVEVEGLAAPVVPAPVAAAPVAAAPIVAAPSADLAPASLKLDYTAPSPSTLVGMPAAPVTSPLPLESIIVDDAFPEKTLELRGNHLSDVAAAAAALDANEPQQTEVLKRSDMPAALTMPTLLGGIQAPHTPPPPSVGLAAAAPAWPQAQGAPHVQPAMQRPSSIAPVAVDVAALPRPSMPSLPAHAHVPVARLHAAHGAPPAKSGLSGAAIGGIVFAAVALIGLVGVGGFAASRALSDKTDSASVAPVPAPAQGTGGIAAASPGSPAAQPPEPAPAAAAVAAPTDPSAPATLDVSALPSAPVPGSAPRGFTGSGSFTPPSTAAATGVAAAAPAAAPAAPSPAPAARGTAQGTTASGIKTTALPAPGTAAAAPAAAGSTPLPPPAAAPAAAPVAAAAQSSTGIVRVDPNLRAVVVDGSYRRAVDGVLTVSCGTHRIKAGMKEQQTINVPCGGSVTL
jgi:hypothetical protein